MPTEIEPTSQCLQRKGVNPLARLDAEVVTFYVLAFLAQV
jgi:hypothetical protein